MAGEVIAQPGGRHAPGACTDPDGCESPAGPFGRCAGHWRQLTLEQRGALIASLAVGELTEPESTCLVPGCEIPDGLADNVPVGDGFLCRGHWARVPTELRQQVIVGAPGAVPRALAAVAASERQLAGRYPPRPVGG